MRSIIPLLESLDFLYSLWLFPVAIALHEAEEWNIRSWYQRNYVDLPPTTDADIRTWLVFSSLLGFVWCAAAILPGSPVIAAYVFLPAIALMFQNALQHVFWLFYFRAYAPGVITGLLLLIPLSIYLSVKALRQGYVPAWYIALWAVLIAPSLIQTVKAGNTMTGPIRVVHHFGIALRKRLSRLF